MPWHKLYVARWRMRDSHCAGRHSKLSQNGRKKLICVSTSTAQARLRDAVAKARELYWSELDLDSWSPKFQRFLEDQEENMRAWVTSVCHGSHLPIRRLNQLFPLSIFNFFQPPSDTNPSLEKFNVTNDSKKKRGKQNLLSWFKVKIYYSLKTILKIIRLDYN